MGERLPRYKVALEALLVVERYVSVLNVETSRGIRELLKADHETRDWLNQSSLPLEVRQAVDRVTNIVTENYVTTIELLDEKNKRKADQTRRQRAEYFVVFLYVLTIFGAFWIKDWKLVLACFPISFIEYRLLNDALPFRVWGRFLSKRNSDR